MHEGRRGEMRNENLIKYFTPNLLIRYLSFNLGLNRHNLSSRKDFSRMKEIMKREKEFIKNVAGVDEKYDVALFEYKNDQTGLKIIHRINRLSSYEDQDLLKWYIIFKETARVCNWNDIAQFEVLKQIVDVNIQALIGRQENVEQLLRCILKLKYNQNTSYKYQNQLLSIKQRDYMTTCAYVKDIEITVRKLAICYDWDEIVMNSKVEEVFFVGLDELMRLEITRYSNRSYTAVLEHMLNLESLLIEKFNKESQEIMASCFNSTYKTEERSFKKNNRKHHEKESIRSSFRKQNKFCHYHKSRSHSDEECRRGKNDIKDKANNKTFTIRMPPINPTIIEVPIGIQGFEYKALIDTGSVDNYIPEHVAEKMKLKAERKEKIKKIEMADGSLVEVTHDVELKFKLFNDNKVVYISKFNLIKNRNGNPIL
ncbi:hypothetical protein DMUE_3019 [Dictyocoela muelleri]|nr:hypothetical protein DMUE_3019 [Dictyocoela muelleri]